jgi:hypothetical protein
MREPSREEWGTARFYGGELTADDVAASAGHVRDGDTVLVRAP